MTVDGPVVCGSDEGFVDDVYDNQMIWPTRTKMALSASCGKW
jgi:hypothetical protein